MYNRIITFSKNINEPLVRYFSINKEISFFFFNNSKILIPKEKDKQELITVNEDSNLNYILTNNIHYEKEEGCFNRFIRIYVDILLHHKKYPHHVQSLHLFGKYLLKEKVENTKKSRIHKRRLFEIDESQNEDVNEYLVRLYDESKVIIPEDLKIEEIIKKVKELFYTKKSWIYTIFTLEYNKILFQYTPNVLIKDIHNCLLYSQINKNKDVYRFIKKHGPDNICVYLLEHSDNTHILKNRYNLIRSLFEEGTYYDK